MEKIVERALRLKELEKLIVKSIVEKLVDKSIVEWELEDIDIAKCIKEFKETRKQIRLTLMEHPVVSNIHNKQAIEIIKTISADEPLPVEKALHGGALEDISSNELCDELTEEEIEELGSDLFYSWFSHYEYVKGHFKVGSLILSLGKLPNNIGRFVDEARECYVFQRYLALMCIWVV